MSDDDISIISLSDDELGSGNVAAGKGNAPAPLSHAPLGKPLKGVPSTIPSSTAFSKISHSKKSEGRRVEPVYEDDEQQYSDDLEYEEEEEDKYDQLYREGVLDEDGLEYISNRFANRQRDGTGPSTWLEVDEEEIRKVRLTGMSTLCSLPHSSHPTVFDV
jgi:hypothetical protein